MSEGVKPGYPPTCHDCRQWALKQTNHGSVHEVSEVPIGDVLPLSMQCPEPAQYWSAAGVGSEMHRSRVVLLCTDKVKG